MELPEQMYADLQAQIPALKEAISTGATYASELGEKIIHWDIAINSFYIIIVLLFFYPMYRLLNKVMRAWEDFDNPFIGIGGACVLLFYFIVLFCTIFDSLPMIIKAIFVPELRLIEIISNLLT